MTHILMILKKLKGPKCNICHTLNVRIYAMGSMFSLHLFYYLCIVVAEIFDFPTGMHTYLHYGYYYNFLMQSYFYFFYKCSDLHKGSSTNHVDRFLGFLDPSPPQTWINLLV